MKYLLKQAAIVVDIVEGDSNFAKMIKTQVMRLIQQILLNIGTLEESNVLKTMKILREATNLLMTSNNLVMSEKEEIKAQGEIFYSIAF